MDSAKVKEISSAVGVVQSVVDSIVEVLDSSGAGGHLNESQTVVLVDLFAGLARAGLDAYAKAQGEPITAESISALFVDETPLPSPDVPQEPVPAEPVVAEQGTEAALLSGDPTIASVDSESSDASV